MTDYTPGGGGMVPAVENPCAFLTQLRAAYYQLRAGQARAEVRNGDQWLRFQRADTDALRHEVRRLEMICGASGHGGRAVRVGPRFPHLLRQFGPPFRY
jgi:hypothetical protein